MICPQCGLWREFDFIKWHVGVAGSVRGRICPICHSHESKWPRSPSSQTSTQVDLRGNNMHVSTNTPSSSRTEHTTNDQSRMCCICLTSPKCVVLMPCKHLCVCESCFNGSDTGHRLTDCPICRCGIDNHIIPFL
jgi:hypothetical protein